MKFKLTKIIFALLLFSNFTFGQSISPYLINNELFELPGKWEFIGKIESSAQWSFVNKKSHLILMINVRKIEDFEFYNKELSEFEFLNKFYVWETEFWRNNDKNIEIEKLETNETDKYIVWRLKIIDQKMENYIMSGMKSNKLIGVSLSDNNKKKPKTTEEKIDFLKKIYFNK